MMKHSILKIISLSYFLFSNFIFNTVPKISVITYLNENSDEFIEGFLKDIERQTIFNETELILLNNNANLKNEKIIFEHKNKFPNIRYINLKSKINNYSVLNIGINISKAELITHLNVQDRFNRELLNKNYLELINNREIDLVYSGYYITYVPNQTFEMNNYKWIVNPNEFSIQNMQKYLPGPGAVWRKSIHAKFGYFDTTYKCSANWEMWLRAIDNGSKFKKIDNIMTLYFHQESPAGQKIENQKIVEKYKYLWEPTCEEKKFVIIIPSYNNKYWYQRNLNSVFTQKYKNYRIIYIDDCSSDKTAELVESYIKLFKKENIVQFIKNGQRKGALENLYTAIHSCNPKEIIVTLDGDDWLASENVLNYLNRIYQDTNIWLTFGQFYYYPHNYEGWAQQIPDEIIKENKFRDYKWCSTHLRTFYAGLFQKINKMDLIHEGKFYAMAWDLAFMFPMLEMAAHHFKFIPEILYVYNVASSINDHKVDPELQLSLTNQIRNKEKYKPIEKLFEEKKIKKIYIYADQWGSIFDLKSEHNRDNILKPFYKLKKNLEEKNINLIQTSSLENLNEADFIVFFNLSEKILDKLKNYPKEKLILFLWEPKTTLEQNYNKKYHEYFTKVYTFDDDLVDNKKYIKFYYPFLNCKILDSINFDKKKLCTMITMNKSSQHENELYSERKKVINFYENKNEKNFDFYGLMWEKTKYKNYKGRVSQKKDILKNYKFCYCYENTKNCNGYITEKIFDCFSAGCVPIYWGAPNIIKYIPKECFISREDFKDEEELYLFLKKMPEQVYRNYIENIKKYISNSSAQLYSSDTFIKIFKEACNIN